MPGSVEESRAVDVVYLNLNKVLDSVSQNILMDELMKYRLRKWIENQLSYWPGRVGISSSGSSWKPRGYPRGQCWGCIGAE